MKSIDRWVSETDALKAQLLIIFGEIEDSVLKECSSKFPKGILLVSDSPSQGDPGVLFKSVSPKTSLIDFSKVLSEFCHNFIIFFAKEVRKHERPTCSPLELRARNAAFEIEPKMEETSTGSRPPGPIRSSFGIFRMASTRSTLAKDPIEGLN